MLVDHSISATGSRVECFGSSAKMAANLSTRRRERGMEMNLALTNTEFYAGCEIKEVAGRLTPGHTIEGSSQHHQA
jgi:hypothetical protein